MDQLDSKKKKLAKLKMPMEKPEAEQEMDLEAELESEPEMEMPEMEGGSELAAISDEDLMAEIEKRGLMSQLDPKQSKEESEEQYI